MPPAGDPNAPLNSGGLPSRPYHKRTERWYHSHMIEWLMANPSGSLGDLARYVGKRPTTVSAIVRSDLFQAALRQRKADHATVNDLVLSKKLTEVAVAGLDQILATLDKKKHSLPLETVNAVTDGALKRLGYGLEQRQQPGVQVNIAGNAQVAIPVSQADLEEARMAFRQHQRTVQALPATSPSGLPHPSGAATFLGGLQLEGAALEDSEEASNAPDLS